MGSYDEVSNIDICRRLLAEMGIPHETPEEFGSWVKYTRDRPLNAHRYAVDGTKLRTLGWEQRTSVAEGLRITVDWYKRYGERWWGEITQVLTPFPTLSGVNVVSGDGEVRDSPHGPEAPQKKRKVGEADGEARAIGA